MRIFERIQKKLNWSKSRYLGLIAGVVVIGYVASATYHVLKPLPEGLDYTGTLRHADVQFLSDQSYIDAQGKQQHDQHIFNQILALIKQAKTTIVLDMFLFNNEVGKSTVDHRALAEELTQALIAKRKSDPNISIIMLTDPINSVYGGIEPEQYRLLRQAGVEVIETNLLPLRASNPTWSGLWYMCCQSLGNNPKSGWLPSPFGSEKVTLRSYLDLANFKANHRKTIVADSADGWQSIVSSLNPHDGSSNHSNVGLLVKGATAADILQTEQSVANFSNGAVPALLLSDPQPDTSKPQVQVLTEGAIYQSVLNLINSAKSQQQIDVAMFYLSERQIIKALIAAHERGVRLRILLDPNKDAFGHQKNGIPNRPVASELNAVGIPVRWCDTHGEQCHSKMILKTAGTESELILGSANYTARNLKNYNLETDLLVKGTSTEPVFTDAQAYFNRAWSNLDGRKMSVDYQHYADESTVKYALYRFMEWSGLSTF